MGAYFVDALRNEWPVWGGWRNYANGADGESVVVRYAWMTSVPEDATMDYGDPRTSFSPLDAGARSLVVQAMNMFSEVCGVTFALANTVANADMLIGSWDIPGNIAGYGEYPQWSPYDDSRDGSSELMLDTGRWGVRSLSTVLHEIGHTLGLEHPFEGEYQLPSAEDLSANTVMSYSNDFDPTRLGVFDIAALQSIYGPAAKRLGNDTYIFGQDKIIWDGGGHDRIDASGSSAAVTIVLEDGSWSFAGAKASSLLARGQVWLGHFSYIEDAQGSRFADRLVGNLLDNLLEGGEGDDVLLGRFGDDQLNGQGGRDRLEGGFGNDTFILATAGDTVVEAFNGGTDQVKAGYSYILSANVENLFLTGTAAISGTGNALDNRLSGNSAANTLSSGLGKDTLNGGLGKDRLAGGSDNDTYILTTWGDTVVEAVNAGTDTVRAGYSYGLTAEVENLELTGTSTINGSGNARANMLIGNSATNVLSGGGGLDQLKGGGGNDRLTGGAGVDTLSGGSGNDAFEFTGLGQLGDVITDFSNASADNDLFRISASGFGGGLVAGTTLAASKFQIRADNLAQDSDDRFIFRTTDKTLWFDLDGKGGAGPVLIADLQATATVMAGDVWLM